MTVSEVMIEAILHNHSSMLLLIDFLVEEKKTIKLTDNADNLNLYLLPKHQERINGLLSAYIERRKDDRNWQCYGLFEN